MKINILVMSAMAALVAAFTSGCAIQKEQINHTELTPASKAFNLSTNSAVDIGYGAYDHVVFQNNITETDTNGYSMTDTTRREATSYDIPLLKPTVRLIGAVFSGVAGMVQVNYYSEPCPQYGPGYAPVCQPYGGGGYGWSGGNAACNWNNAISGTGPGEYYTPGACNNGGGYHNGRGGGDHRH